MLPIFLFLLFVIKNYLFSEVNNDLNYVNENQKNILLRTFNNRGWVDLISFMRFLVLMKLTKDTSYQVVKNEYIDRMIVPANLDVHALKIEAVKELIIYLEETYARLLDIINGVKEVIKNNPNTHLNDLIF